MLNVEKLFPCALRASFEVIELFYGTNEDERNTPKEVYCVVCVADAVNCSMFNKPDKE